jgi:hypothetical protein
MLPEVERGLKDAVEEISKALDQSVLFRQILQMVLMHLSEACKEMAIKMEDL